ncbi:MAG: hypothetical protein ACKOMX_01595 [Actinomycetota bacterium]
MTDAMEIIEQGEESRSRGGRIALVVAAIIGAAALAGVAVLLLVRSSTTPTLAVVGIQQVESVGVEPNAEDSSWEGKLGMPSGATLPGAVVRVTVSGDPRSSIRVQPAASSGALHIEGREEVEVPAGGSTELTMTITPTDCTATLTPNGLDEAGYRWRKPAGVQVVEDLNGTALRLSGDARAALEQILAALCEPAGAPPTLTFIDARLNGTYREQILDITARVGTSADRALTHPLDGPALRGIGAFERPGDPVVTLMWRVAPLGEQSDGVLDAYVRVITVTGDTAYPWVVRIVPPADLRPASSSSS